MIDRQVLTTIGSALIFMIGIIVGVLSNNQEIEYSRIVLICVATIVFFLVNYVPIAFVKLRR
jgi:hypothetical protein